MKPREKLLKYWEKKLEWWELVAIILWSWIKWQDIFKLSKKTYKIIKEKNENLKMENLLAIKWIWKVKAIQIIWAFELVNRHINKDFFYINSSSDIIECVKDYRDRKQEYLLCITLDWANRFIKKRIITIGLLNESLIHPREIFSSAIEDRANSIVVVHNHPSWMAEPSKADINSTIRLKEVSNTIWIKLLDHIIITKNNYFSFAENSLL